MSAPYVPFWNLLESADGKARAEVAADIYAALPGAERETIATMIAAAPGITWLGDPDRPDEHAAARPDYAGTLTAALARRGHTTIPMAPEDADRDDFAEPVEAASARRTQPAAPRPAPRKTAEPTREQHAPQVRRPQEPGVRAPQHRR